jgi:hypothetical protein
MSRKVRLLSAISAVALLLASCGGGDSSSRTKNSALCYDTQEAKDEAVQVARDAFDAAMGGGTPGDPLSDTTVPATEDSVVDEAPSDTVVTDSTSADGGGYRRPAVRAASSGDTSVPPSLDGGALTPEQQQAQMDLEAAEAQPLCEGDGAISAEKTCDITLTREIGWSGASNCEEVVVEIVNTMATAAIGWQANVGSQVVASGTWDSDSEQTKVVTFMYTPEAAQDAASEESTTVTCTGTISGTAEDAAMSDDCPDGFVYSSLSADGMIWVLNKDGNEMGADGAVLASGPLDISGLTPEIPVTFKISYDIASQGVSSDTTDGEDSPCSMTLTSTGISWSCSDGSLFNVAIEDMSNPGVYPLVECSSSGSLAVADGQQFRFNFYLVNGVQTFFEGYNDEREQNVPISFETPEDTEGVCTQSAEDGTFSSVLPVPGVYAFSATEDVPTDLYVYLEGGCSNENNFAINWYVFNSETEHYEYSSTSHPSSFEDEESQTSWCEYGDSSTYGGNWIAEFVGTSEVFASTNVDLTAVDRSLIDSVLPELADMPNSYTFDGAAAQYNFVLTEETRVSITVNSNQSCDASEMDDEENGFVDPEIDLYEGNAPWSESNDNEIADDDNGFHSADNCSAAFFDDILPAGSYFILAENDDYGDGDTGTITVNSSVELDQYLLDMNSIEFTTLSATVPSAVNIDVPSGGGHFVATLEAPDDSCDDYVDPYLVVLDLSNGATIALDDDSAEDFLGLNCYSSLIDVDLAEGKYLLIITTYNIIDDDLTIDDPESGAGSVFELKYGFIGNEGSQEQIVVEPSNDPIPPVQVPPTPDLPVEQLKSGSNSTLAVDEGVSTMVCSSTCVEDLFALEGVTGDVLTVSVGSESIVVKRGASKVRVPVSAGAKELVVTQKTANGTTEVVGTTKVITAAANLGSTTTSTSSESGSNMLLLIVLGLGALVIAGAGTTLVRRRKAN